MTERIRELELEAIAYADSKVPANNRYNDIYYSIVCGKFAELIVGECLTMSDELKAQYLTSRKSTMDFDEKNIYAEGEAACDVLKYKMKKHFGVEE